MSNFVIALLLSTWIGIDSIAGLIYPGNYSGLTTGIITGLILGNADLGMQIGAYWLFFDLSWAYFETRYYPNSKLLSLFSVFYAIKLGDVELGILTGTCIAVDIEIVMVAFDHLWRLINVAFQQYAAAALAKNRLKCFEFWATAGVFPRFFFRAIPVFCFIMLYYAYRYPDFGRWIQPGLTKWFWQNDDFITGLRMVGRALPAVGFAQLLTRLHLKKYWHYLLLGFVCFAYFKATTLLLFLLGSAFACLHIKFAKK